MHIMLTISYDGTNYAGWQRQDNAIAVQQILEEAISTLLNRPVTVTGASRTDAGVHALGQRASFHATDMRVPLDKLPKVLVGLLPSDISVIAADIVPEHFSPRFAPLHKTYTYTIYNGQHPNPLKSRYSTFISHKLDIKKMCEAAKYFVGKHDFAAFCSTGSSAKTTVREIFSCSIQEDKGIIKITVCGNAFLYNMVRIIAGTLMYVGLEKIQPAEIPNIIAKKDRKQAGKTMPPQGLTLIEIAYPSPL